MNRSTLILLIAFPCLLHAGLFPRRAIEPPVANTVVAYSNGIYVDRRVPRSAFLDFLTRARYSASLPPDVIARRDQKKIGWFEVDARSGIENENAELILRVEGVFSDSKGRVFYWEFPDPRVLVFVSESGEGGYFWVGENQSQIQTESRGVGPSLEKKGPNQALEHNDPSRHASCCAPVAPTGIVAHL